MTEDTKRAIEIIQPIADELDIKVTATDRILRMDGQAIGISCNSTYATLMEMIGWIFLDKYVNEFRRVGLDRDAEEDIARYWINEEALRKVGIEE